VLFTSLHHYELFKTALKSLLGNGLKTWLTVFVLSVSFVLIIFMQGCSKAGADRR
jgi:cell division protein FtsX